MYDVSAAYEEKACVEKFGDARERFIETVPGMDFASGIIRLVRRGLRD